MTRSAWLAVFVVVVITVSGIWIASPRMVPFTWLAVIAFVAAISAFPFELDGPRVDVPPLGARDLAGALAVAAPALFYLAATWRQEFPHNGDQSFHNGLGVEAKAALWPWIWILEALLLAAVIVAVKRGSRFVPLMALVALAAAGAAFEQPFAFELWYPGTLHFFSAPLRALPLASPLNALRLLNTSAILVWLLVLRPRFLGRRVDIFALAAGALLLWQKDDVYYFTSGYLEPWAIVLLLTAAEHVVRFGSVALWRPLLLLGAAAMVKEHVVMALPLVAVLLLPKAKWSHYVAAAAAIAPFLIFLPVRATLRPLKNAAPQFAAALSRPHLELFVERVRWQFGVALPVVVLALIALAFLATRSRAFLALFLAALADFSLFFFAWQTQGWAGYARLNLVPLALAALTAGVIVERVAARRRAAAVVLVAVIAIANAIPLVPFLRDTFRPDTARNFVEHSDAPLFFPLREAIESGFVAPGQRVDFLHNGKWLANSFYPGPPAEQYADLAARHRIAVKSFRGMTERCRCTSPDTALLAGFVRFDNLGANVPQRAAVEREAARCRAEIARTCTHTKPIVHEGVVVGLLGRL